ncbi:LANO_0C08592g1_1 [Lachancea nothofagi CBS 11611]|uniref:LANO_0C08592g1_1 n=1 Tax=Lachancea nothofagi CBS 11611 TaxID=1266666 RepID=A0A1G4J9B7_9SACH|nr:LANO_0C08592g1_1 [Lachancea nothofagi CBS 11611]
MQDFYDNWDTQALYQSEVDECYTCDEQSPVPDAGILCGPTLRLIGVDYEHNLYRGSMLLVCRKIDAPSVSFVAGPSNGELASGNMNHGHFNKTMFYVEDGIEFYRYTIQFPMEDYEQLIKYTINGEDKPHYRFYIPSQTTNFNTISHSCNGFSLSVDTTKFHGSMWFDILNKHAKTHYHVMLGGGDQIYSDGVNIFCKGFQDWLKEKNPATKYRSHLTSELRTELDQFYLKEYLEWYGYGYWKGSTPKSKTTQKCFPIAMATIPSINIWDDHDIIDGFGSYSHSFQMNEVFRGLGKAAYKYYMLFQHHVSIEEKGPYLEDPSWLLGHQDGDYIGEKSHSVFTRLGPSNAMLGLDCRTERELKQIVSWKTYDIIFKRLEKEVAKRPIDHLMVMLGVPIAYPRLVWLEWIFSSRFLAPLKYLARKGVIAHGLVNSFNGDVELLDDLNDHWCARHHKKERNYLVAKLQDFGAKYGTRVTILSGDVHLACVGRFRSKLHSHHVGGSKQDEVKKVLNEPEKDLRLMFNIISSAVVNTPPPNGMAALLQKRSGVHHFDHETDEDVVPLFKTDVDGSHRAHGSFMNRRNWSDLIPIENILAHDYLRNLYQISEGDACFSGLVTSQGLAKLEEEAPHSGKEKQDVTYPITAKGLIATIHAEKDSLAKNSQTEAYAVVIPELQTTQNNLSHTGIKHINMSA